MESVDQNQQKASPIIVIAIIVAIVGLLIWQFALDDEPQPEPVAQTTVPVEPSEEETIPESPVAAEPVSEPEPEPVVPEVAEPEPLPMLNDSDTFVQQKLATMTWRKELLKLVINEDMIRRMVVFTDNFARGIVAYEHSPVVLPSTGFSAIDTHKLDDKKQQVWLWDENSARRFSLYVDLLRSFDSESLVQWYRELKPLIDQAYAELGYGDADFTEVLQQAITRVLDMEIPKQPIEIVRPSVMFQYKDADIEALDDADKLLLRLGKENLLVIKSVLLEISEKIARQENG